ncbi:hypothetical protein HZH66_009555 [Vespula vulgaris]|uniref:Uncharacterized protein n=1 Tax=Vespula vulgaris TaxID=7454 RepID=A0A834JN72_VESVU|nr:hypothetical protein HZH66_009555 [Vespula vulgaris]
MRHVTLNPTTGKTNDVTESKASGFIEEEQGTTGPTFEANDQTAEYSQFLTVHQDYSGSEVIPTVAGSSRKSFNGWRWWRRLEKDEEEHRQLPNSFLCSYQRYTASLRVTKLEIYHPKKITLAALSYVP